MGRSWRQAAVFLLWASVISCLACDSGEGAVGSSRDSSRAEGEAAAPPNAVENPAPDSPAAKLSDPEIVVDLGIHIVTGQLMLHREVEIVNSANSPIQFIGSQKSCGCTHVGLPKDSVPPGEKFSVQLNFSNPTKSKGGYFDGSIRVLYRTGPAPEDESSFVIAYIGYELFESYKTFPEIIELGTVLSGDSSLPTRFTLMLPRVAFFDGGLTVLPDRHVAEIVTPPGIVCEVIPLGKHANHHVDMELPQAIVARAKSNTQMQLAELMTERSDIVERTWLISQFSVHAEDARQSSEQPIKIRLSDGAVIDVPVKVTVLGKVSISPKSVALMHPGPEFKSAAVVLTSRSPVPLVIEEINVDPALLRTEVSSPDEQTHEITFHPQQEDVDSIQTTVEVVTNQGRFDISYLQMIIRE